MKFSNRSIELMIIFKGDIKVQNFVNFVENLSITFSGSQPQNISFSSYDGMKLESKDLIFNDKSKQKVLTKKHLHSCSLYSLFDNYKFKSRDFQFSVRYNANFTETKRAINITLNEALFLKHFQQNLFYEYFRIIYDFIINQNLIVFYGFIFSLDNIKFPGIIVNGIANNELTSNEEKYVNKWFDKKDECGNKIWKFFWGNLVTRHHFINNDKFELFKKNSQTQNTYWLSNDNIFFHSNSNNSDFSFEDFPKTYSKYFNFIK